MGFTREHISELIRLVEDKDLRWMEKPDDIPEDEDLTEWYGQIHAWRTLAQLKAEEAIPALIDNLQEIDEFDDEWYGEDAFEVFPMIGIAAIRPLAEYLGDNENGTYARVAASVSLQKMSETHPETRDECVAAIVSVLEKYRENDETINGSMISDLMQMSAGLENVQLIEEAFKANCVDIFIDGDFEDVQVKLGLIEKRITTRRRLGPFLFDGDSGHVFTSDNLPGVKKAVKKEKNKRKLEKKSRKRNRKKK
jgi:hypothetical protein